MRLALTFTLIFVALVLLAGCAYSPAEFREVGTRTTHTLKLPPEKAAYCMARNIEGTRGGLTTSVRPLGDGSELLMRIAGTGLLVSVGEMKPSGTGSHATVWMTPNPFYGRDEFVQTLVKDC